MQLLLVFFGSRWKTRFSISMRHVLKSQFHHHISVQLWFSYIIPLTCSCLIYRQRYLPWGVVLRSRNCIGQGPSVWHTVGAPELLFQDQVNWILNQGPKCVFTRVCDRLVVQLSNSECQSLEWKWRGGPSFLQFLMISSQDVALFLKRIMPDLSLSSRFRAISLLMPLSSCLKQMGWKCLFAMRMRGCMWTPMAG